VSAARGPSPRAGVTLIELLVSVAIALMLTVFATIAFVHIQRVLERMRARLEMHNSARFLHQSFSEQTAALQQDGAMWVETTKDDGSGDGVVAITFLKGKTDEHGYTTKNGDIIGGEEFGVYQNRCCDLEWTSWRWDQKRRMILTGTNTRPRQFSITTPWVGPNGSYALNGGGNCHFINMPQPLRQAVPYSAALPAGSAQAALNGNRYGSPDVLNDLSDWQDLSNQMAPAIRNVTDFRIELILADGTVIDADRLQDRRLPIDGCYVDARVTADPGGGKPFGKRPRLIRLMIDMTEPVTGVRQSFSFSFQPPGLLPLSYPIGATIP
jgi:prepilin-type N-terminal cleavage/methylation domain-containing protein